MQRRRVLAGLATAGVSLLAGCNSGGNGGGGNNTTQATTESGGSGGPSPTSAAATTAAATTMATTAQQTATQMATTAPSTTAVVEPMPTTGSPSAPMTTGASPATAAPTGMETTGSGTAGLGTATGIFDVNISKLKTYSGDSFSIKRPAGWKVVDESSSGATFQSQMGIAVLTVTQTTVPSSVTSDQLVSKFLQGYQQGMNGTDASVEILNKRTVTLSNGNAAKVISIRLNAGSVNVRQDILLTVVNGTAYIAAMTVPEKAYSSVSQQVETILLSLTVRGGSTSG